MLLSPLRRSTDIPLDRDPAARTLPWIIAVMAFLATIALAGALLLNGVIVRWSNSLTGTITIQATPSMPWFVRGLPSMPVKSPPTSR